MVRTYLRIAEAPMGLLLPVGEVLPVLDDVGVEQRAAVVSDWRQQLAPRR
jgi:hypothetical protein